MFYTPHKKIALFFLSLIILLFITTLFFLMTREAKMIVVVGPRPETSLFEKMIQLPKDLAGKIIPIELNEEQTFLPRASLEVESIAKGEVEIINNSNQNLNLVKTTRFLSKNNLLFRLEEKVFVPAKGKIKAMVYADKEGKDYEIGPSHFSLPGLSESLKSQVYAENKEQMKGGLTKIGKITEKDIEEAKTKIENTLSEKAKTAIENTIKENQINLVEWKFVKAKEEMIVKPNANPGDEKGEFRVIGNLKIILIGYNETDLLNLVSKLSTENIPADKKLKIIENHTLSTKLRKLSSDNQIADLDVSVKIITLVKEDSPIFDLEKIQKMKPSEIIDFLEQYKEIESVNLKFNPFWKTKTPEKIESISIKIYEK